MKRAGVLILAGLVAWVWDHSLDRAWQKGYDAHTPPAPSYITPQVVHYPCDPWDSPEFQRLRRQVKLNDLFWATYHARVVILGGGQ